MLLSFLQTVPTFFLSRSDNNFVRGSIRRDKFSLGIIFRLDFSIGNLLPNIKNNFILPDLIGEKKRKRKKL